MRSYAQQTRLLVAVDCILFGFDGARLQLLVIQRGFNPGKGKYSLPGGFVGPKEMPEQAAQRILFELTGLKDVYMEHAGVFGDPKRDPAERTISLAYFSLINLAAVKPPLSHAYHAAWVETGERPKLIFDHDAMVEAGLAVLRHKAAHTPLLFELLPKQFTMQTLRELYGAVYNRQPDPGNFSRKMLQTGLLVRTTEKDPHTSRKGSWYYRVNRKVYDSLFTVVPKML